jgi:hypothetical protein
MNHARQWPRTDPSLTQRQIRSTVDSNSIVGLIFFGVLVVLGAVLVVRARALREKDYRLWLDSYRATTAEPETDPNLLRERWLSDMRTRDEARRAAATAQSSAPVAMTSDANRVQFALPTPEPRTNTLALLSFIFCLLGGLLGIVFGHIALSQIKRTGEGGRGLAIAGLVIGYTWIGLFLAFLIVAFTISSMR